MSPPAGKRSSGSGQAEHAAFHLYRMKGNWKKAVKFAPQSFQRSLRTLARVIFIRGAAKMPDAEGLGTAVVTFRGSAGMSRQMGAA